MTYVRIETIIPTTLKKELWREVTTVKGIKDVVIYEGPSLDAFKSAFTMGSMVDGRNSVGKVGFQVFLQADRELEDRIMTIIEQISRKNKQPLPTTFCFYQEGIFNYYQ